MILGAFDVTLLAVLLPHGAGRSGILWWPKFNSRLGPFDLGNDA